MLSNAAFDLPEASARGIAAPGRAAGMARVALAGNPNSGKTTLFNAITGARQRVGNYPGITVEKKEGQFRVGDAGFGVIDLPGTYSLTAYSQEELVARQVLVQERPQVVVDVADSGSLERSLYLTVQLLELGIPVVLALNMMDEARAKGLIIDTARLAELLDIPVVETVAREGRGVPRLLQTVADTALAADGTWTPLEISYGPDLDPVLSAMVQRIERDGFMPAVPARWVAIKYLEGDEALISHGRAQAKAGGPATGPELEKMVDEVSRHVQATLSSYPEAVIADYRYGFINSILRQGVLRKKTIDRIALSDRLDKVLTHPLLGPVSMAGILYLVYLVTFAIGDYPVQLTGDMFSWLGETVEGAMAEGPLRSLLVSGIIDGVGGVLSFVPLIAIIFLIISFLEDSGYMARMAYMLDRVFRAFGLHGCSVMPFIISGGIAGGCAVPGVMAARTLRSPKEKLATILTAPFMTCGAKLPVFLLLTGLFFPEQGALAMFCITLAAWAVSLLVAAALRATLIRGASTPFVMELPPYRMPTLRGILIHTWERTFEYIRKAGTMILAVSILLWVAMSYPGLPGEQAEGFAARSSAAQQALDEAKTSGADEARLTELQDAVTTVANEESEAKLEHSAAGRLGQALEPASALAGFDWRVNIALIAGTAAKEVVVSALGTAYSLGKVEAEESEPLAAQLAKDPAWTFNRGLALIAFAMLYSPCFATLAVIKQETGSWGWAAFSLVFNTALAFVAAVAMYQTSLILL